MPALTRAGHLLTIHATKRPTFKHPLRVVWHLSRGMVPLAFCVCASTCVLAPSDASDTLTLSLNRLKPTRPFAPRLSIAEQFRPCFDSLAADGSAKPDACAAADSELAPLEDVTAIATQAAREVERTASPSAMHVAALLDLLWSGTSGKSLDRSISYLQHSTTGTNRPEYVLTDLAAAHLVRGERSGSLRDAVEALNAANRARELDSVYAPAVFDAALALERLGLGARAASTWTRYLQLDSSSAWSAEARQRLRRLTGPPRITITQPPADTTAAVSREFAIASPQGAVDWALGDLLPQWARAALSGDNVRAQSYLSRASLTGRVLSGEHHDAMLSDITAAIGGCARARGFRAVAEAHRDFGDALAAYRATKYETAARAFESVAARSRCSSGLARWAETYRGISLLYEGQPDAGRKLLATVLARVEAKRAPLLLGRVHWPLATYLLRAGENEESLREAQQARAFLVRAGETQGAGAVETLVTDIEFALGDEEAGYRSARNALSLLQPPTGDVSRHNLLFSLTKHALRVGLSSSALEFANADVANASASHGAISRVEARLSRAQVLLTSGLVQRALVDVDSARHEVDTWPVGEPRSWFRTAISDLDAQILLGHDPRGARELFDSVVAFFDRRRNALRLVPALLEHADAAVRLGDATIAAADLRRATTIFEAERAHLEQLQHQQTAVESARRVYDALIMRRAAAQRPSDALALLESSRLLLSRPRNSEDDRTTAPDRSVVGLEFLLVADTLLTWAVTHGDTAFQRSIVNHDRLLAAVQALHSALAMHSSERETHALLVSVYDLLLRPVRGRLPGSGPLLVVADGELADVPYAALIDSSTDRYVVEDYEVRSAERLREPLLPVRSRGVPLERAVLIGDPVLASSADSNLARLPGASDEASMIAALYPEATLLNGSAASRQRVRQALSRAEVVHYAGHAVFDDAAPEQSYLTIAPDEQSASGRLTALELSTMDLRRARLVVLSGCRTLGTRPGRTGGFVGFASAVLAAGAGGVVGSMWPIDDHLTRRLMFALHRSYRRSADAPRALREAQLQMLRSPDPAQRSPSMWGAFRYVSS